MPDAKVEEDFGMRVRVRSPMWWELSFFDYYLGPDTDLFSPRTGMTWGRPIMYCMQLGVWWLSPPPKGSLPYQGKEGCAVQVSTSLRVPTRAGPQPASRESFLPFYNGRRVPGFVFVFVFIFCHFSLNEPLSCGHHMASAQSSSFLLWLPFVSIGGLQGIREMAFHAHYPWRMLASTSDLLGSGAFKSPCTKGRRCLGVGWKVRLPDSVSQFIAQAPEELYLNLVAGWNHSWTANSVSSFGSSPHEKPLKVNQGKLFFFFFPKG